QVDGVGRVLHGAGQPEGDLSGREVVDDRLRNADDAHPFGRQLVGHTERVLAADDHERVDALLAQGRHRLVDSALDLVRVGARGAEDGATPRQDAAAALDVEGYRRPLYHASPPLGEADQLVAVVTLAPPHHRPDDRVEPRAVAPTGEQ